ncbi:MAG: trypsin-like peptidase domain-containing protein [Acidobacteria bacterium]|nr:trypsin-like peptidase domain-containing protein [Acidobacteriota bacterium]
MRHKIYLFLAVLKLVVCLLPSCDLLAQSPSKGKPLNDLTELSASFQALSERVSPAVVQIFTTGFAPVQDVVGASTGLVSTQRSGGSGVLVDPDGYIVTNAHVVEGARRVQVLLAVPPDERAQWRSILKPRGKTVSARIVGIDRETDLAVLKVEQKGLAWLELGDSDRVRQGQLVLAFGSPLGLENSVSLGVVSSVARQLGPEDPMIYIQTDATINPGNSGGPLVDTEGRVVGINTFIVSQSGGSEGIGFAAPSNIVRNVFRQIRRTGRVRRGQIGVATQSVTPTLAAGLGLTQDWGVVVGDVFPGGPAEAAGVEIADLILTLDGKVMENARQFDVNLYQRSIGDAVTLEVLRGSQKLTKIVSLWERANDPDLFADLVSRETNLISKLGILGAELDDRITKMLPPLREPSGILVAARAAETPSQGEGFLPGDVIHSINGAPIRDLAGLRATVGSLKVGDPVVIQIERFGQFLFLAFEIE